MRGINLILIGLLLFLGGCYQSEATQVSIDATHSDIFQWMVDLKSIPTREEGNPLRAFLWIPSECVQLKGLVLACHNLQEEGILTDSKFRESLTRLNFGVIWVTPGWDPIFDVEKGAQIVFEETLEKLAELSGYTEIEYVPIVYMGHSAHASSPYHFAAWNSEKTLAMLSIHGDSPLSDFLCCNHINPDWGDERNIDGIPGLISIGEHEWLEERLRSAFPFMKEYPKSTISLLCDAGHWHNDISDVSINYLSTFIEKAVHYRMPPDWDGKSPVVLKKTDREKGWLADRWRSEKLPIAAPAPYAEYKGDRDSAFWYFDEEMALLTDAYYARERGKKHQYLNIKQQGEFIDVNQDITPFIAQEDGITFNLQICFTDSTGRKETPHHSKNPIHIKRVSGAVHLINDSTYQVQFYRMGTDGHKTGHIDLIAYSEADDVYRRGWRRVALEIPKRLKEGIEQKITFPEISNTKVGERFIELNATSDSGLPVSYYIKGGPAVIEKNKLLFSAIPPKAKYPLKVTVVAYQYGRTFEPKIQTAEPVERTFLLEK